MQIRKRITLIYIVLSVFSTLLLSLTVFVLFRQNNEYYFLKRLQDRAKIVASIHYQEDPEKAAYYRKLKKEGLEELVEEKDYVLKVNSHNNLEYNTGLKLPHDFYSTAMKEGKSSFEEDNRYFYGQVFNEDGQRYLVIITALDRRGPMSTLFVLRIMLVGGIAFLILAYFLGKFLARTVLNPVSRITKEVNRISASNLHNRLALPKSTDEIAELTHTFNDMLDRLETSFEIQANFINNASHELKTPITTIMAEAEIAMLKKREAPEYEQALSAIHGQASRLAILTESMLKLTQTGYDGTKQVLDVARIDELLMDIKQELDKLYPGNQVSIRLDQLPEDDTFLLLPCNRPLLELAISNIISNGIKYSNNQPVFVSLEANRNVQKITITDIGIGIPKEDVPYLFEPFFRGKNASKQVGYGLGLTLAGKIIRMHGGQLQIASEPDKGTVVGITFRKTNIKKSNELF